MKRWPTILLILSLVANIFLVGAIAGSLWHWTHHPGPFRGGWRMRVADTLPEEQGETLRQAIRDTVDQSRPIVQQGRAAREEAARLFVQPRFDAAAVSAKLDQARAADVALRTQVEQRIVQFAAGLPVDQRQKMAEALKAGPFREGRHPH